MSSNGAVHQSIELINLGEVHHARQVLAKEVLNTDNATAWAFLTHLAINRTEQIYCLEQVVRLQPENHWARMSLNHMRNGGSKGDSADTFRTQPFHLSDMEIGWPTVGPINTWGTISGGKFQAKKPILGWGVLPDRQRSWPFDLKFRSLTAPIEGLKGHVKKPRRFFRLIRGVFDSLLVTITLGALILLLAPRVMGANLLVVISQSMEPTLPMGSIVISDPKTEPAEISVGDVITFSTLGPVGKTALVTHRVVEVIGSGIGLRFRTQGDASEDPDLALVSPGNLVGEVWFSLPLLGYLVAFIRTPVGYLTLIGLPALLIILGEWWEILRTSPVPKRRRVAPVPLRAGGAD